MKALITGVGGFCGAHLVSRLRQEANVEIAGVDRMAASPAQAKLDRYFQADITDGEAIESAIRIFAPNWLFHLAGVSGSFVPPACIYAVNVSGTVNVLEAIRRSSPNCRVLLAGSSAEYGAVDAAALPATEETVCKPVGAYGISKYAATLTGIDYARRFGLNVIVARPSNVIGPGVPASLVVGAILARAKQALGSLRPLVKVGDFESERDFIDVADVVDAYVRLVQSDVCGEIFNLSSGRAHSIRHVAETLVANSSRPIELEFDPNLVSPSIVRTLYCSYQKAERAIGFRPSTSLEETLKACWRAEMRVDVACA